MVGDASVVVVRDPGVGAPLAYRLCVAPRARGCPIDDSDHGLDTRADSDLVELQLKSRVGCRDEQLNASAVDHLQPVQHWHLRLMPAAHDDPGVTASDSELQ